MHITEASGSMHSSGSIYQCNRVIMTHQHIVHVMHHQQDQRSDGRLTESPRRAVRRVLHLLSRDPRPNTVAVGTRTAELYPNHIAARS